MGSFLPIEVEGPAKDQVVHGLILALLFGLPGDPLPDRAEDRRYFALLLSAIGARNDDDITPQDPELRIEVNGKIVQSEPIFEGFQRLVAQSRDADFLDGPPIHGLANHKGPISLRLREELCFIQLLYGPSLESSIGGLNAKIALLRIDADNGIENAIGFIDVTDFRHTKSSRLNEDT